MIELSLFPHRHAIRETSSCLYLSPPQAILPAAPPVHERGPSTR
jgi:hypothetical protein